MKGCLISAYQFLLIVEILAKKCLTFRNNKNVKEIKLQSRKIEISQLADDTILFLENEPSMKHVKEILNDFEIISGLKTNIEKTQAFMI